MRGEYKVPDGKLVAVDLEVEHGRLRDVSVLAASPSSPATPSPTSTPPDRPAL